MKRILSIFLLVSSISLFSQEGYSVEKDSISNEEKLAIFFKENIPKKLLKNITYPDNSNEIKISFYVNKENLPFRIFTNTSRDKELNELLIASFKKYPIKELKYPFNTKKKYSFRIIKREFGENNILIDSVFTETIIPNCSTCNDLDFYIDIQKCINDKIRFYYYKNIDFSLANKISTNNDKITLKLNLYVDSSGVLNIKSFEGPEIFEENIQLVTKNFPETFSPSTINHELKTYSYNFSLSFKKGDFPEAKEPEVYFDSIFKPTTTNDFAIYLKDNLSLQDIKNANLNKINDRISIYFELDSFGKPKEITTTSRSKNLENKIIELFKNYNLNNLNFVDKHPFNRYFTSIIVFENGVNIVKTNSIISYNRSPMYKGCEKSVSVKEARNCFSRQIQIHFARKFNTKIINTLKLSPGPKRIYIYFMVDKKGKITNITCKAPHKKITDEVLKVMKKLPKVKPAIFGRKKVNINYNIPFTLIVE